MAKDQTGRVVGLKFGPASGSFGAISQCQEDYATPGPCLDCSPGDEWTPGPKAGTRFVDLTAASTAGCAAGCCAPTCHNAEHRREPIFNRIMRDAWKSKQKPVGRMDGELAERQPAVNQV